MVIQRNWKLQSGNSNENVQQSSNSSTNNSSDDSNGSNQTVSSSNTNSSKGQNFKYVTNHHMAENVLSKLRQRFNSQVTGSSDSVMRSLELLRINVQSAFDREIDVVIKRFMETYFKPAFKNIKENLGDHVVSEDVLQKMSCALLENSKDQYNIRTNNMKSVMPPLHLIQNEQNSTINIKKEPLSPPQLHYNIPPLKRSCDSSSMTGSESSSSSSAAASPSSSLTGTVSKKPLLQYPSSSRYPVQYPTRRQIFWNTANISTETLFLLDVQANQAFGFGTDGRERLASKHPELIRYLPDIQDRDWLVQQKIIPEQNRNSRFLFLIYDEVIKLGQSDLYKNRENLNLQILHSFKIPNFIIQKMKIFFIDLNIKSRGLITNSYSSALVSGSHLRNALLQGSQNMNINNNSNGNDGNGNNGNGMITQVASGATGGSSSIGSVVLPAVQPTSSNILNETNSVSTTTPTTDRPKPKSTLSSSHATLTALLTNTSNNNGGGNNNSNNNNNNNNNSNSNNPDTVQSSAENG